MDDLNDRETFWIHQLNTLAPVGYNMTTGGDGGDMSHSPNYKRGISQRVQRGSNNPNFGKLGTSSPNYGKQRTREQKDNIKRGTSAAWSNNLTRKLKQSQKVSGTCNPMYGRLPPNALVVVFGGEKYDSLTAAARATGHSPAYIKRHGDVTRHDGRQI